MSSPALRVTPLGGVGVFGMNCTLFEWGGELLVVDAGVKIPQGNFPGVDLILPDFTAVVERASDLRGIVLTHGHDDHIGALPYLLAAAPAPVHGTALTLALARERLADAELGKPPDTRQLLYGEPVEIGPFTVEAVRVYHSVPESAALVIRAPGAVAVHSGDFRLGANDVTGCSTDLGRLAEAGEEGVDLLLCDSTNADRPGVTPAEAEVARSIEEILRGAPGRVFVATFASHLQRLGMVMEAARRTGRRVSLEGRRMTRNFAIGAELGHLRVPPGLLTSGEGDERAVFLVTGSQGEPTSALARIARGEHAGIRVRPGDTVVFSSRLIPGNELAVGQIVDDLFRMGAKVHYQDAPRVHVSGHGSADEVRRLVETVRPRAVLPIHGEYRQLKACAAVAVEAGVDAGGVFVLDPGQSVEVGTGGARRGPSLPAGRMMVDGEMVGHIGDAVLRDRRRLAREGAVLVVTSVPPRGETPAVGPEVLSVGVGMEGVRVALDLEATRAVSALLEEPDTRTLSREELKEAICARVRGIYRRALDKRPLVVPVIIEE